MMIEFKKRGTTFDGPAITMSLRGRTSLAYHVCGRRQRGDEFRRLTRAAR